MKKQNVSLYCILIISGYFLILISGCQKDDPPDVQITSVTEITKTTATCNWEINKTGGVPIISGGISWSLDPGMNNAESVTKSGLGKGDVASNITGLTPFTTYYVRAFAINEFGIGEGEIVSFTTNGTVVDIDNNVYNTVTIGTQVWMKENLKVTRYNNGTAISLISDGNDWMNATSAGYCWYINDESTYGNVYGALYNYAAVETGKLCPTGWRVPNDYDWNVLTDFLGGKSKAGGKLKESDIDHWSYPNSDATNSSGFTALPGGTRNGYTGEFVGIFQYAFWWTSQIYNNHVWYRKLHYDQKALFSDHSNKLQGQSVRCIKY